MKKINKNKITVDMLPTPNIGIILGGHEIDKMNGELMKVLEADRELDPATRKKLLGLTKRLDKMLTGIMKLSSGIPASAKKATEELEADPEYDRMCREVLYKGYVENYEKMQDKLEDHRIMTEEEFYKKYHLAGL